MQTHPWLLPEGIEDLLGERAERIESTRRKLLDHYRQHAFQLVIPPPLEYGEALLDSEQLDRMTFRTVDEQSGRTLRLRADITPQIARIDARANAATQDARRYCYVGSVTHTRPQRLLAHRWQIQVGAELFGACGLEADVEIILLMLDTLAIAGIDRAHLCLGHAAILPTLLGEADTPPHARGEVREALRHGAADGLETALAQAGIANHPVSESLRPLLGLSGDIADLPDAVAQLKGLLPQACDPALEELAECAAEVARHRPQAALSFDLSHSPGHNYHTGLSFSCYAPQWGYAITHGGRYDGIGGRFGAGRPATGFSADLVTLADLARTSGAPRQNP